MNGVEKSRLKKNTVFKSAKDNEILKVHVIIVIIITSAKPENP